MTEEILIKVKYASEGYEPAVKQVENLGKVASEDVAAFNALDQAIKSTGTQISSLKDQLFEAQKASKKLREELATKKDIPVQEFNKLKQEADEAAKKVKVLKDQISESANEARKLKDQSSQLKDKITLATPAVSSLKQQLIEAKNEATRLGQQFGFDSEQALAAQKNVAGLTEELSDFNKRVQALNPEAKFQAFSQVTQGSIGALQTLTGALQAFGVENEAVNEIATRLQGILNLSQGINSILSLGDAFKNLRVVLGVTTVAQSGLAVATEAEAVAMGQATVANYAFAASLSATGIGAIVVAIGLLVGALYGVKVATEDNTEAIQKEIDKLREKMELQGLIAKGQLEILEAEKRTQGFQLEQAQLQGKTELEILQIKQQQNRDNLFALQQAQKLTVESKEKLAIDNEILDINNEIQLQQLRIVKAIQDRNKEAQEEAFKAREEIDGIARRNTAGVLINADVEKANLDATKDLLKTEIPKLSSEIPPIDIPIGITQEDIDATLSQLQQVQDAATAFFDLQNALSQNQTQSRITDLEAQRDAGKITEKQYNDEVRKLRTKQAEQEKQQAIFNAAINIAVAITKALPNLGQAALAAALGAIQLAAITARPVPKFKEGTLAVQGINQGKDSVMAMLQPGEAVIPTPINKIYHPTIEAVYNKRIPANILNATVKNMVSGRQQKQQGMNYHSMRYAMDGMGIKVKNVDQLASAIAAKTLTGNRTKQRLGV